MADLIQTAIFKLRDSVHELNEETLKLDKIAISLPFLKVRFEKEGYELQKLKDNVISNYDIMLFYKKWLTPIKWKEFIGTIAEDDQEILQHKDNFTEGFVLLIKHKKNKRIYSITGGFGYTLLQNYCDYEFGLDVLSRLIKTDHKVLKAVKERNFTGGILGSVKFFRSDYNLNENESFGNFYQELSATLNNTILTRIFCFSNEELKKGNLCVAKSSFTLKKLISFRKSIQIIESLDSLLKLDPIVDLNLVKKLSKSDTAPIKKLNGKLLKILFDLFSKKERDTNIELCHKDFDKYYDADSFKVSFSIKKEYEKEEYTSLNNFKELIPLYRKQFLTIDIKSFGEVIESTEIISEDENGSEKTRGKLKDHICAELKLDGISYFLINKEWYHLTADFEAQLNNECQEFIDENRIDGILNTWNELDSENQYNEKHIGINHTLVFDKVCPENIEVCDIMKIIKNKIYFIHVKKGSIMK